MVYTCTSACTAACTPAALVAACASGAILNSCNAAASSSRRSRADDREYYNDLRYSLLEEGRRNNPRPALADDAVAGDGRREDKPGGCCCPCLGPAWKIAIKLVIIAASLLAAAFLAGCHYLGIIESESRLDGFALLAYIVMLVIAGATVCTLGRDCVEVEDPELFNSKRRMHAAQVDM